MLQYAENIAPILQELDETCPLSEPVGVVPHIIPLFEKHSSCKTIEIVRIPSTRIQGLHIHPVEGERAIIFPRDCSIHDEIEPACIECQLHRLSAAKETIHTLDTKLMKTPPGELAENIIDQLIKGAIDENAQVHADGMALYWAIELLVRFRHRVFLSGNFNRHSPHSALLSARRNSDWSFLARQYGVPSEAAKIAFSERYMATMKEIRESVGLSVEPASFPEWDH